VAEDYEETTDEYKAAQAIFRQSPHPQRVAIYSIERTLPEAEDLEAALNELVQLHNDWYWLVYAPREQEADDLTELAAWVAGAGKFCRSHQRGWRTRCHSNAAKDGCGHDGS